MPNGIVEPVMPDVPPSFPSNKELHNDAQRILRGVADELSGNSRHIVSWTEAEKKYFPRLRDFLAAEYPATLTRQYDFAHGVMFLAPEFPTSGTFWQALPERL